MGFQMKNIDELIATSIEIKEIKERIERIEREVNEHHEIRELDDK